MNKASNSPTYSIKGTVSSLVLIGKPYYPRPKRIFLKPVLWIKKGGGGVTKKKKSNKKLRIKKKIKTFK
jgi:hypothetical protein